MDKTTITISINIATADKHEGNSEKKLVIYERDLTENPKHTSRVVCDEMHNLIYNATIDYVGNNLPGNIQPLAQRFKAKASELLPHMDDLQDLDERIDDRHTIDEAMFRKSEYIGGMAAGILAVLELQEAV